MIRLIACDLDGTLLDSMGVWDQVDIDFLNKRGIEVPPDYMTKVSAMQFRQIAEYTIARFGLTDTPEELMQEWDDMASVAYSTTVEAKPGALDYLRDLKASGVKLGVATSLPPHLREPALRHVGMFDLFNDIVSDMHEQLGYNEKTAPPSAWVLHRPTAQCSKTCWSA